MSGRIEDQINGERVPEKGPRVFFKIKASLCLKCGAEFPADVVVVCGKCGSLSVERVYEEMELPEELNDD